MLERNAKKIVKATVVYDNKRDKEFLDTINLETPIFIDYINMSTKDGRKLGFSKLNYWSAKKLPFIVLENEDSTDELPKVFYSELGNAVNQLIKYLNESKN